MTYCTISVNSADDGGGLSYCGATITNCTISGNSAVDSGGGLYNCSGDITYCIISGNVARGDGGALCNCCGEICNNTIVGNSVQRFGGGIYCGEDCSPVITNNIVCNIVSGTGIYWLYSNPIISYNNLYGNVDGNYGGWAWPGEGDISVDPCFVDAGYWADPCNTPGDPGDDVWIDGDYHLKSQAGIWDPNSQTWVVDEVTSLCIDAGDPNSDWTAELWPHGKRINLGVYGGTAEASMSGSNVGNIANRDNDVNDMVDFVDFALFAGKWQASEVLLAEDLNRDGFIDFADLAIFADHWLGRKYECFYYFGLDADAGWTTEGQWAFGQPAGSGGASYGNPDPNSGYTGANVYGVNLDGDYDVIVGGPYYLTAGPFDCSTYHGIRFKFARWLNTDSPDYVVSKVEASNDGTTWEIVWEHSGDQPITDDSWQMVEYDISSTADGRGTVYIRWSYQILDERAYPHSGWNIDDIQLWGSH